MTNQDQFYERLSAEYNAFIDRLKTKTPDEILVAAYEKVCKEEIVIIFENNEFSDNGYAALLQIENPLDTFYKEWLDTDSADMEAIRDCVTSTVKRETGFELSAGYDEHYDATEWRDRADREEPEEHGDYSLEERIAAEIAAKSKPTAHVINGSVSCFDVVISISDDYPYLVGEVNAVDKLFSAEHHSGSLHDDIFVDFQSEEYSAQRKSEIEAHFGERFDKISLDNIRIAPELLIVVPEHDIPQLLESRENAEAYCNAVLDEMKDLETDLINRVEQNYADFKQSLDGLSKGELVDMAAKIHAYSDAYSYMTAYHAYSDEELLFYSQFTNPLEVVSDAWHKQKIDLEDMSATMDFVYEQSNSHLSVYPLKKDEPVESVKTSAEPSKETRSAAKEKSAFERGLERGKAKADADRAQKASEPTKTQKNKEAIE